MNDSISRAAAIDATTETVFVEYEENADKEESIILQTKAAIRDRIKALPPVQPKHGKWIERESGTEDKENGFETVIVCSCCDFPATTFYSEDCESRTQIRTDFCPNCGADMRKRGEADGQ